MIWNKEPNTVFGVGNTWSTYDIVDFRTVFSPSGKGKELYNLIYNKIILFPKNDALKNVSHEYGFTAEEAFSVVNGSLIPIFNNPRKFAHITQEQALDLAQRMIEDYADLKEIFELQQELETNIVPSEVFANGDLADSGFDLIYDLTLIEEILFINKVPPTVNGEFPGALDSPYQSSAEENKEYYLDRAGFGLEENTANEESGGESGEAAPIPRTTEEIIGIVEEEDTFVPSDPQKLQNDVCATESSGGSQGAGGTGSTGGTEESSGYQEDSGVVYYNPDEFNFDQEGLGTIGAPKSKVTPAPKDKWQKKICPTWAEPKEGFSYDETISALGFESLGEGFDALLNDNLTGGYAAQLEAPGISVEAGICLTTDLVYETLSSYQPGDSCVRCEIDKINGFLDKTLSHSLVPNKVTGNLFESAKCKDAFEPFLDIKFIAIPAPVSTPLNDDLIFGKNIVEEWNKFIERYQPLFLPSIESTTDFELQTIDPYTSRQKLFNSIQESIAEETASAMSAVSDYQVADTATNTMLYSQTVLAEIAQMKSFFTQMKEIIQNTDKDACSAIKEKPYLD